MGHNDIKRAKLEEPSSGTSKELEEMREQMRQMQMQIDILNEAVKILKKDRGVELKNREKATIVDALNKKYKQPELLASVHLPKSSYYYIKQNKADKYCNLRQKIIELFEENKSRYGYRRIHALLVKERIRVSEKIVRRLMREEKLEVKIKRTRKYYSYKGEITPAPANVIARDFHAEKPNEKWLSDLTEFAIPAGKVYLSPMVDCFDGYICAWTIGTNPNAALVNKMLVQAIGTLKDDERPIIHTDRGCHYRWDGWIALMEKNMLKRSMSAKGCSPDNSACEGFFGRLKNEFFYGRDWRDFSIEDFIAALDDYLHWYNDVRIKKSLGFLSPRDYRQKLGLVS